jgi:hypothetical protein
MHGLSKSYKESRKETERILNYDKTMEDYKMSQIVYPNSILFECMKSFDSFCGVITEDSASVRYAVFHVFPKTKLKRPAMWHLRKINLKCGGMVKFNRTERTLVNSRIHCPENWWIFCFLKCVLWLIPDPYTRFPMTAKSLYLAWTCAHFVRLYEFCSYYDMCPCGYDPSKYSEPPEQLDEYKVIKITHIAQHQKKVNTTKYKHRLWHERKSIVCKYYSNIDEFNIRKTNSWPIPKSNNN